MKKLFRSMMFVAAAAMTFASCSKDPVTDKQPAPEQRTLHFVSDEGVDTPEDRMIESRTHFGAQYVIKWNDADDQVGVYIHDTELLGGSSNKLGTIERVGAVAHFTAQVDAFSANDLFCAYYPFTAENNAGAASVKMTIPAQQTQELTEEFNGSNNPMVAACHTFTAEEAANGTIKRPVKFRQLGAIGEFAIYTGNATYEGEVVRSLSFTNSTAEVVAGTFTYDLTAVGETGETTPVDKSTIISEEGSNSVSVSLNPDYAELSPVSALELDNVLYLTVLPGEYTGDFVVTTDKATYTFKSKTVDFRRAYVRRFSLDLNNAVREEVKPAAARYVKITEAPDDWTGIYLIVSVKTSVAKVLSGKKAGENVGDVLDISGKLQEDGSFLSDAEIDGYACEIEPSANGYTILYPEGYIGYEGTASSGDNYLYFNTGFTEKQYEWTFSVSSGSIKIQNVNNTGRRIRLNSTRFAAYGSDLGDPIQLYRLDDKTPRILVGNQNITFSSEVLSGTVPFRKRNLTGDVTATVTDAAGNWFTATADNANDKVDWTATANDGTAARTAMLTLSADGAEPVIIAVTQFAPAQPLGSPALNAPTVDGNKIAIGWNAVENASGYAWRIVKTAEPGTDVKSGTTDKATTAINITGLDATTEYTIYVKAVGDNVLFADSAEASVNATTGESVVVEPVTLVFGFTSTPAGWPTAAVTVAKEFSYTLNGTDYPWTLFQAYIHTTQKTLWFVKSKKAYATLPAMAGMKITKVEFKKNSGGTKAAKVSLKLDGKEIGSSTSSTTASFDVTEATSSSVVTICNDTSSNFGLDSITITYEGE